MVSMGKVKGFNHYYIDHIIVVKTQISRDFAGGLVVNRFTLQ